MHKISVGITEAKLAVEVFGGGSHAIVEWAKIDVPISVNCICGASFEFRSAKGDTIGCPDCRRSYVINNHLELIEVSPKIADVSEGER